VSYHNPRTEIAASIASGMLARGRVWNPKEVWSLADELLAADPEANPAEPTAYEKALEEQNAELVEALERILRISRDRLDTTDPMSSSIVGDFQCIGYTAHRILAKFRP
jgi:hypothetical protein